MTRSTETTRVETDGGIIVDTHACTLEAPAATPWAALRRAAQSHGMSLDGIVDVFDDETVGASLSRPALLPPLWPAHTARGACIALTGHTPGGEYRAITAPRTASGPDLRALFFEADGRFGEIGSAVFGAERVGRALGAGGVVGAERPPDVRWIGAPNHAVWDEWQDITNRFGNVVSLHGQGGQLVARVRVSSRVGVLAARSLHATGAVEARRLQRFVAPHVVAVVPWESAQRSAARKADVLPLCAGPTHVALGVAVSDADERKKAQRWATTLVGGGPGRVVTVGLEPAESPSTAAPMVLGEVSE